jgi:hypothetical protein
VADEQLAKAALERGRKRERQSEEPEHAAPTKRMRSTSVSSVSTISTNASRSPSPIHEPEHMERPSQQARTASPPQEDPPLNRSRATSTPRSERKRRRGSFSSNDSYVSGSDHGRRASSRSVRRRYQRSSQSPRGRRMENRSPRGRRGSFDDRQGAVERFSNSGRLLQKVDRSLPQKERSLSPFSKRLALTQAMNMSR